jgi:shikimate kinase
MPSAGARPIFLCGPMGCGKSTVARLLAQRLGRAFVDTDEMVVARAGMSISDIFARFGEPAFRAKETAALCDAAARTDVVVALGGGALLAEENRALVARTGTSVYLRAQIKTLEERLRHSSARRPLLAEKTIAAIVDERRPIYEGAERVVDVDARTPDEIAAAIAAIV